jgi:hypothetical protein
MLKVQNRNISPHFIFPEAQLFFKMVCYDYKIFRPVWFKWQFMNLYMFFPSNGDLVIIFLHKRDENFRTRFMDQVDGKADTPKNQLLAIFDVIGEWMSIPAFRGCTIILDLA